MSTIPAFIPKENYNYHPHIVILGAGASLASFPNGDKNGKNLPLMNNLVKTIGLESELRALRIDANPNNFEALFDELSTNYQNNQHIENIKDKIYDYFTLLNG